MIMEWRGEQLPEPEIVSTPVDQKKPVRSAAATKWEAEQARLLTKTGLERPTRPSLSVPRTENESTVTPENLPPAAPDSAPANPEDKHLSQQIRIRENIAPEMKDSPKNPVAKGHALTPHGNRASGFQRLLALARVVLPVAQSALPLLEGNVIGAVANVVSQRSAAPRIDIEPLQQQIENLKSGHGDLDQHLNLLSGEIDTISQQAGKLNEAIGILSSEMADLKLEADRLHRRVSLLARLSLSLLAIVILANIYLILHILHVAP